MKKSLIFTLFISQSLFANILFIGDSHTAGPFGANIFTNLKNHTSQDIVVLGHASSAPKDWLGQVDISLSGGVFNKAYVSKKNHENPSPTHWRVKVKVPKLSPLLNDMLYHDSWKSAAARRVVPDTVVVELGANDYQVLSDDHGNIRNENYLSRLNKAKKLISLINDSGAKCIWVGPPMGRAKQVNRQRVVYKMIEEATKGNCDLYDSNHFVVQGCDGKHMNCASEMKNAKRWAQEVANFIFSKS